MAISSERRDNHHGFAPRRFLQPSRRLARPNIPLTIGAITFAITVIAAVAAMSARETYRIHMNDLGRPGAVPVNKQEYDRLRTQSLANAAPAKS